jgi:hypothetical protein
LVWLDRSSHSLLSSLLRSRHLQRWRNTVVVTAAEVEASTVEVAVEAGSTAVAVVVFTAAVVGEVSVAAVVAEDFAALAEGAFVVAVVSVVDLRQAVSE